jgi:hypothetical protein
MPRCARESNRDFGRGARGARLQVLAVRLGKFYRDNLDDSVSFAALSHGQQQRSRDSLKAAAGMELAY